MFIFKDGHRVSQPLPKFVAVGPDTSSGAFIKNTLRELVAVSHNVYQVSEEGHYVAFSVNPVILSGDNKVKSVFTGGPAPNSQACAVFEVCNT